MKDRRDTVEETMYQINFDTNYRFINVKEYIQNND